MARTFPAGAFRPDESGNLRLAAREKARRFTTIGEFCDAVRPRLPASGPAGLLMMVDGAPIGFDGLATGSDEQAFVAYFTEVLDAAGVDYAIVIPASAEVSGL